jgi:hypothetical protein
MLILSLMSSERRAGSGCLFSALVVLLAGCGQSEPKLHPLRGKVAFKGEPVPKAELVFHPQFDGPGWMPVAITSDDGTFEASTKMPGDGVLPGRYKVTVVWHPLATEDDPGPNHLPAKFAEPTTTPFEIEAGPTMPDLPTLDIP